MRHARVTQADRESRPPDMPVRRCVDVRPHEGGDRSGEQDRRAAGLGAQEAPQRRLEVPHPGRATGERRLPGERAGRSAATAQPSPNPRNGPHRGLSPHGIAFRLALERNPQSQRNEDTADSLHRRLDARPARTSAGHAQRQLAVSPARLAGSWAHRTSLVAAGSLLATAVPVWTAMIRRREVSLSSTAVRLRGSDMEQKVKG